MKEILSEWWQQIAPLLLTSGIKIVVIIVGAYLVNQFLRKFILSAIIQAIVIDKNHPEVSRLKRQQTLTRIFSWLISILIFSIVALMILDEVGVPIGPLLASAGIVGLAVGFGGQYLIRDVISGFFIILENQYRIGDIVNINETGGLVEDISFRMTTLRDLDGTVHHIPHGEIKKVSNLSKYFSRVNLNVGVSYNVKLDHVIEVVNRVGIDLASDHQMSKYILKPPQFLRVEDFADSAIVIKILGETLPMMQWEVTGELRKRLKIEFDKEGIEIPFPQRVLHTPK